MCIGSMTINPPLRDTPRCASRLSLGVGVAAFAASCVLVAAQTTTWTDTSGHRPSLVTVAPDVTLEVLDWGGNGTALILLAGLNNSPVWHCLLSVHGKVHQDENQ